LIRDLEKKIHTTTFEMQEYSLSVIGQLLDSLIII